MKYSTPTGYALPDSGTVTGTYQWGTPVTRAIPTTTL